ncbi:CHASE2 domain-containing protein [bacterium CPR1]|nr:CHASE2 domain-containing protein [bacterium CPR1]
MRRGHRAGGHRSGRGTLEQTGLGSYRRHYQRGRPTVGGSQASERRGSGGGGNPQSLPQSIPLRGPASSPTERQSETGSRSPDQIVRAVRSSRLYRTFLPFLLALLGWLARISLEGVLSPLEAYPYDTALKYLTRQEQGAKIILAGIDDETHQQGKFNRLAHAQFLINMREHGARVVFLDLLFDAPRDEEMDAALTEAVNETGLAVLACTIGLQTVKTETGDSKMNQRGTLIESLEESLAAGRALPGLINCYNDPTDQKVRTAALAIQSPDLDRPWPAAARCGASPRSLPSPGDRSGPESFPARDACHPLPRVDRPR